MSLKNSFGKTSVLNISTIRKEKKTILDNIYFTAPFKIMSPFCISWDNGGGHSRYRHKYR